MERSVFDEDNLKIRFGEGLYACIEQESQLRKISKMRKEIRIDKGILFPTVWLETSNKIPEFNVQIIILGKVKEDYVCDIDNTFCFIETLDHVCDVIYKNVDAFKDFDYESEIIKLEKERTREGYKKILTYYTNINPNKKMQFHYLKKIASFNFPSDLREFEIALRNGTACKPDPMQARKVSYKRDKFRWRDDQIF